MKKIVFIFLLFSSLLCAAPINKTLIGGLAVEGYDAVAYFTMSRPVKGSSYYELEYQGAKWRFSSQKHLDLFKANPTAYMPQYGGYCAWAMAQNKKADIDPAMWKIINQKLYLNYSKKIQTQWEVDIPGFITAANRNWTHLSAE